jgi:hypothetical protein
MAYERDTHRRMLAQYQDEILQGGIPETHSNPYLNQYNSIKFYEQKMKT